MSKVFFDLDLKVRGEGAECTLVHEHPQNPKLSKNKSEKTHDICGSVAQLVEQRTENPCVAGSNPALATTFNSMRPRILQLRHDGHNNGIS